MQDENDANEAIQNRRISAVTRVRLLIESGRELAKYKNYAYKFTQNMDDAEDCVSAALTKAVERLPALREEEKFEGWFWAILRNECHNLRRNQIRRPETTLHASAAASNDKSASSVVRNKERRSLLRRAFQTLTNSEAIVMRNRLDANARTKKTLASSLEMTRSQLYRKEKTALEKIKRFLNSLGIRRLSQIL